jgi:hypothetical protein
MSSLRKQLNSSSATSPISEENCQLRLNQIRIELKKSTSMMNNSQHPSIQSACLTRISKLKKERQLYQIIQERYNVQSMLNTTQVKSVRVACKERMKQLLYELETLKDEMNELDVYGCQGSGEREEEDRNWFDNVVRYMNESAPSHDDISTVRMSAGAYQQQHHHHQQQQQQPRGHGNNRHQSSDNRRILSPRRYTMNRSPVARAVNSRSSWF